jgi:hypothetical protein
MTRIDELLADGVRASGRRKARAEKMLHELEFLESTNELRARECHVLPPTCICCLGCELTFLSVPPTVMPLFEKLKQVPKSSELLAQPPSTEKQVWQTSHEGFLAWGASKAMKESRKPGERDTRTRIGANSLAAAEFLRQMDNAVMENGDPKDN